MVGGVGGGVSFLLLLLFYYYFFLFFFVRFFFRETEAKCARGDGWNNCSVFFLLFFCFFFGLLSSISTTPALKFTSVNRRRDAGALSPTDFPISQWHTHTDKHRHRHTDTTRLEKKFSGWNSGIVAFFSFLMNRFD